MKKPNYESYNAKELKEAISGIDRHAYPDRLQELIELLDKRLIEFPDEEHDTEIYASFGPRLIAYLIDSFFLCFLFVVAYLLVHGFNYPEYDYDQNPLYGVAKNILVFIYFVGYWVIDGKTPGKSLLGLKVINESTGKKPSLLKSTIRYIGYFISSLPLGLGFLWSLWHPKNKTWHDMMSGTVVVWEYSYLEITR